MGPQFEEQSPKPYLVNIGYDGKVKVFFSKRMILIEEFHILNQVTIEVRNLKREPVINLQVIPAPG